MEVPWRRRRSVWYSLPYIRITFSNIYRWQTLTKRRWRVVSAQTHRMQCRFSPPDSARCTGSPLLSSPFVLFIVQSSDRVEAHHDIDIKQIHTSRACPGWDLLTLHAASHGHNKLWSIISFDTSGILSARCTMMMASQIYLWSVQQLFDFQKQPIGKLFKFSGSVGSGILANISQKLSHHFPLLKYYLWTFTVGRTNQSVFYWDNHSCPLRSHSLNNTIW